MRSTVNFEKVAVPFCLLRFFAAGGWKLEEKSASELFTVLKKVSLVLIQQHYKTRSPYR